MPARATALLLHSGGRRIVRPLMLTNLVAQEMPLDPSGKSVALYENQKILRKPAARNCQRAFSCPHRADREASDHQHHGIEDDALDHDGLTRMIPSAPIWTLVDPRGL